MDVVIEQGFGALSIHGLAKQVDYTPGALYRYFASKDALIAALITRIVGSFGSVVTRTATLSPQDRPLQRVSVALASYKQLAFVAPHRFGLVSLLLAEPRMVIADLTEAAPALEATLAAWQPLVAGLRDAQERGELDDGSAESRAVQAFSLVHGLMQLRKQQQRLPGVFDIDECFVEGLTSLFVGWGADRAHARAQVAAALAHDLSLFTGELQ